MRVSKACNIMELGELSETEFDFIWKNISSNLQPISCALEDIKIHDLSISATTICTRSCPIRGEKIFYELSSEVDLRNHSSYTHNPREIPTPGITSYTSDKKYMAKAIKYKSEDKSGNMIEIWEETQLIDSVNLMNNTCHGDLCLEETFSSMVWNKNNDQLFYIAESLKPKLNKNNLKYHEFHENFGEKLGSIYKPDIFCLNILTKSLTKVFERPFNIFPSKLFFTNNDLYFLAYEVRDFARGLLYCSNQPYKIRFKLYRSALYILKDLTTLDKLTTPDNSVISFSVHPKFPLIFILERPVGGPHLSAVDLILIDSITLHRTNTLAVAHKLNEKWNLYQIDTPEEYNYNLLSVKNYFESNGNISHLCVCAESNLISPWAIVMFRVTFVPQNIKLVVIVEKIYIFTKNVNMNQELNMIQNYYFDKNRQITDQKNSVFSGILVRPLDREKTKSPLIVISHGGPHSISTIEFQRLIYLLICKGFIVYLVNYRGSIGFDQVNLTSILGNIGRQDVDDVHVLFQIIMIQFSVISVCKNENINFDNIHCLGGSHGGFITAHLISQYPDFYKSSVLRNPVIDLTSMYTTTDIPEWVFTETGLEYPDDFCVHPDYLLKLYQSSPLFYAKNVFYSLLDLDYLSSVIIT
ncbi:hypothetical protein HZS_7956, partial [Henneguya salminicola]